MAEREWEQVKPGVSMPVVEADRPRGLPRHVASHVSGGRDLWSEPLLHPPEDPRTAVLACLREVLDPEIPISVVDLGLIYAVDVREATVTVELTFTATACPCMEFIREDISDRLMRERWIDEVVLREVWDPPWTSGRISASGRDRLRKLGVGV